jgi:hypothetical protein
MEQEAYDSYFPANARLENIANYVSLHGLGMSQDMTAIGTLLRNLKEIPRGMQPGYIDSLITQMDALSVRMDRLLLEVEINQ